MENIVKTEGLYHHVTRQSQSSHKNGGMGKNNETLKEILEKFRERKMIDDLTKVIAYSSILTKIFHELLIINKLVSAGVRAYTP